MVNIANKGIKNRIIRGFLNTWVKNNSFRVRHKSCTRARTMAVARKRSTFKREVSDQRLMKLVQVFRQTSVGKTCLTKFAITLFKHMYRKYGLNSQAYLSQTGEGLISVPPINLNRFLSNDFPSKSSELFGFEMQISAQLLPHWCRCSPIDD